MFTEIWFFFCKKVCKKSNFTCFPLFKILFMFLIKKRNFSLWMIPLEILPTRGLTFIPRGHLTNYFTITFFYVKFRNSCQMCIFKITKI